MGEIFVPSWKMQQQISHGLDAKVAQSFAINGADAGNHGHRIVEREPRHLQAVR
jgi:hypothetical protein